MGCSRTPGVLNGYFPWAPARTPGPLGRNDQSDPNTCAQLGDTPGALGWLDGGDPTLPLYNLGSALFPVNVAIVAGRAFALAAQAAVDGLLRAPWMPIAEAEARQFQGQTEGEIQKVINFQKEVGIQDGTMIGNDGEWCAAFANWCLAKAGYVIAIQGDTPYAKVRVDPFRRVTQFVPDKTRKGSPKEIKALYVKIDKPVFGALGIIVGPNGNGQHVGFVYSQPDANTIVLLGGNQKDRIKFSSKNWKATPARTETRGGKKVTIAAQPNSMEFYVPASYEAYAKRDTTALPGKTANDLNDEFGIKAPKEDGAAESVR
jgi:hypothetical protein